MPLNPITADSVPDFDDWGPDTYWECADWVTWHKAMVAKYGKAQADYTFGQAWQQRSAFGHELTCSLFDASFISYFKSQGYTWDPVSGVIVSISKTVTNVASGAETLSHLISFIIPLLFIIAAVGLVIWANKKFQIA